MKKLITVFILISMLLGFNPFAVSAADEKPKLKITKNTIIDKNNNSVILPYKYDKIRKVKYEKKVVFVAENDDYITLYSPDGLYDNFLTEYYKSNKYNSNINFIGYPNYGIIKYKENNKFGLIYANNGMLHITKPIYDKIMFPDETSSASRFLEMSFAPPDDILVYRTGAKGGYKFLTFSQILTEQYEDNSNDNYISNFSINEEIQIAENSMNVIFNGINVSSGEKIPVKKMNIQTPSVIGSLEDLYSNIADNSPYLPVNYPQTGELKIGYHLFVYNNSNVNEILLPCNDFYIENSLINRLTGANISFQNPDTIIAKNGNWGIINRYNEIKTPFIYDVIYPLTDNYKEEMRKEWNKIVLEYKGTERNNNLFLAKKGYGWGIINENNEIIVPFEYKKRADVKEIAGIKSQIYKKIQADEDKMERAEIRNEIPATILNLILLPLWLIVPYPGYMNVNITY